MCVQNSQAQGNASSGGLREAAPDFRWKSLPRLVPCRKDGTWNDRVFDRSKGYGTAVVILALLGDKCLLPPKYEGK